MTTKNKYSAMQNLFTYGLSFAVALMFMLIYWLEPVYTYVKTNVTNSNILPYAAFVIIFIICQIVFQIVFKRADIDKMLDRLNPRAAVIIGAVPVLIYAVLLLVCYRMELYVFDTPTSQKLLYHAKDKVTIMILIGIFSMTVYVVSNIQSVSEKTGIKNILLYIFALTIGVFYCYSLFSPNAISSTYHNMHHFNAYYNSVYSAMHKAARSELNTSVYGFYGFLLAPFVRLLGGSVTSFFYVICILALASYMCIVYVIVSLVKNDVVKVLGIAAPAVVTCSMHWDIYLQLIPHRTLFAGFMAAYLLFGIRHELDRKMWFKVLGYVICALSVIWNFETGVVILIAYVSYFAVMSLKKYRLNEKNLYFDFLRLILEMIVTVFAAWVFTGLVNVCLGGSFISFKTFIFPLMNSNYMDYLVCEYQRNVVAWLFIAATAMLFIAYCLSRTNLNPMGSISSRKDAFMFVIAVIVLGQMTYYINRQAYGNLTITYFMSVVMMCVLCDSCINAKISEKNSFAKTLYTGFAALLMSVLTALCIGGIYNYTAMQQIREDGMYKDTSELLAQEEEIEDYCEPDTKAMGPTIPVIYSDLGWDSQYYFIDFADLGVYPDSYQYISDELNNNLSEPILLDNYVFEALEDADVDLSAFYEKFSVEKTFTVGMAEVYYYVPNK